ncbi:BrnT family toxin [Azotobacter chroococcum]|uniref:BrnT family toxin n=1 Tax=Azotobacter chroococcum TaxID=353 RepID=UPI0010AE923B|nr:BrnT family toxin [Azotobacter chroococcum]TKD45991.1 BrnT family toxin [Azotobacter chroococcum]
MEIEFDPAKAAKTREEPGLDFADAATVFAGHHFTIEDTRNDYGEPRFITVGFLAERMIVLVWTPRDGARRIISMRKANEREQAYYREYLDRP